LKVRLDENLSYRVANALKAFLSNRTGFEVTWVRDSNPPGTDDPTWIRKFALEGGYAVVSGDGNILQKWPNLIAYAESGLISFFPPPGFQHQLTGFAQAALLIRWWPSIIEKAKISDRGTCWRLPMGWTPDVTKFEPIVDPRIRTAEQRASRQIASATVHQFRSGGNGR
jgi:PIN like domain